MSSTTKVSIFTVTLQRDGISRPWGFRMAGGCDLDAPLVVTKVIIGSPSDGQLKVGDIIRKIADYDARDLRHKDALNLFQNAGASIILVIQREVPVDGICNGSLTSNQLPMLLSSPLVAGGVATPFTVAGLPPYERAQQSPVNNLIRFPPQLVEPDRYDRTPTNSPHMLDVQHEMQAIYDQPYRTNPLVLPGAKVNKDPPQTVSYLRHHPNPMMRSPPSHYEWVPEEVVRKQKVVLKQFNSPIGLYSEQNIANSVQSQTGLTPLANNADKNDEVNFDNLNTVIFNPRTSRLRKTIKYDPSKSETYKALQETVYGDGVQEVNTPPTPRVFSPVKVPPKKLSAPTYNPNRASPQPHPTAPHSSADYGVPTDEIHQSNSFKRLMNMVLTENSY